MKKCPARPGHRPLHVMHYGSSSFSKWLAAAHVTIKLPSSNTYSAEVNSFEVVRMTCALFSSVLIMPLSLSVACLVAENAQTSAFSTLCRRSGSYCRFALPSIVSANFLALQRIVVNRKRWPR